MNTDLKERSEIELEYQWELEDLYSSRAVWENDLKRLQKDLKAFSLYRGSLGKNKKIFKACLDQMFDLLRRLYRLDCYAMCLHDQDARVVEGQELKDRVQKVGTDLDAGISFVRPEILKIPANKLSSYLKSESLKDYHHFIQNITRRRKHLLSSSEEEIVALTGNLSAVPEDAYQTLATVNLPFPEVVLKDRKKVTLTQAAYTHYRASADAEDRRRVFEAFWEMFGKFRESFAVLLAGAVSRDHTYTKIRRYKGDLQAALDGSNVPTSIYHNMLKQARGGLTHMWRYLTLRKKFLGLAELHYHDLYASIVPSMEMKIPYQEAKQLIQEALAPLGPEYQKILSQAFKGRWQDVYPTKGKRSGAYSSGSAYDVHPYVLLNYNDDYESLSTLAHELGHALHSYLSNHSQPFVLAHYPIFVAEVASTVNENLLRLFLMKQVDDPKKRLFLLGQHLENFRTTVFRQALFAEFELIIHERNARGEALTADALDQNYLALLREYYGEAEGFVKIDPMVAVEWAYIPHFYYNFYMFQYTTSFVAATAIADSIVNGDTKLRDRYLQMLKAGGSCYPVELLRQGGVDLRGAKPYQQAFLTMVRSLDEIEAFVPKHQAKGH